MRILYQKRRRIQEEEKRNPRIILRLPSNPFPNTVPLLEHLPSFYSRNAYLIQEQRDSKF